VQAPECLRPNDLPGITQRKMQGILTVWTLANAGFIVEVIRMFCKKRALPGTTCIPASWQEEIHDGYAESRHTRQGGYSVCRSLLKFSRSLLRLGCFAQAAEVADVSVQRRITGAS
jgi:hypothetical protein